jgi:predicted nuclease with RNAse H fold
MITVGVDLAAEPKNTAMAVLTWDAAGCNVNCLDVKIDDAAIIAASTKADKVGLDCPIGWPEAFVKFVLDHRDGRVTPRGSLTGLQWRHPLANRMTDDVVHDRCGMVPLSVSADRIARPAMRAASLLSTLAGDGERIDRTGDGLVVEVYPAASLKRWKLTNQS